MTQRYLITGATGFVGGHFAEACIARGHSVRAIVRPQSDVTLLNHGRGSPRRLSDRTFQR